MTVRLSHNSLLRPLVSFINRASFSHRMSALQDALLDSFGDNAAAFTVQLRPSARGYELALAERALLLQGANMVYFEVVGFGASDTLGVAQAAGIKEHDCLVGIDGQMVTPDIAANLGKQSSASLTFVRAGKTRHINSR